MTFRILIGCFEELDIAVVERGTPMAHTDVEIRIARSEGAVEKVRERKERKSKNRLFTGP